MQQTCRDKISIIIYRDIEGLFPISLFITYHHFYGKNGDKCISIWGGKNCLWVSVICAQMHRSGERDYVINQINKYNIKIIVKNPIIMMNFIMMNFYYDEFYQFIIIVYLFLVSVFCISVLLSATARVQPSIHEFGTEIRLLTQSKIDC